VRCFRKAFYKIFGLSTHPSFIFQSPLLPNGPIFAPPPSANALATAKANHLANKQQQEQVTKQRTATANQLNAQLNKLLQQQQQNDEAAHIGEILQQLPGDLMNAMIAAHAATANAGGNCSADESMLAHFLQRSLVEPKRREAAWSDQELGAFKVGV
jgi:hypothetical protein